MAKMIRYRSILRPELVAEVPDTDEGRAEFYDPDAPAETAQEAEEAAP